MLSEKVMLIAATEQTQKLARNFQQSGASQAVVVSGTDLAKWDCNSGQVYVGLASIPDNHKSPATNFCCKTKKEWCCMTCCVSNSCMYPCVPMLGRGRYASVSHDRRMHVHEHAMRCRGTRPFSNRASQPATAQKFAKCSRALHESRTCMK